jgi:Holliday junction resolvasome RuvABC endonuclease subunit
MTTVMALDLSLAATGLAWWRDGVVGVTTIRTWRSDHDVNGWADALRHHRIMRDMVRYVPELVGRDGTVLCAKEARLDSKEVAGSSLLDLAGLHAVVDHAVAMRQVPIVKLNLAYPKIYLCGNGKADKPAMLAAAQLAFGPKLLVANHNEADALAVLAATMDAYDHPIIEVPATHRRFLDRVKWPAWRGLDVAQEVTA